MTNKKNTIQLESLLEELVSGKLEEDNQIVQLNSDTLKIKETNYKLLVNYRQGFQLVPFEQRYQSFFEKFDFIVGDWASEMLRLRGFYQLGKRKVPRDQLIDFLDDYLKEYVNFGAAYFVLGKEESARRFSMTADKAKVDNVSDEANGRRKRFNKKPSITTDAKSSEHKKRSDQKFTTQKLSKSRPQEPKAVTRQKPPVEEITKPLPKEKNFVIKKVKKP